MYIASEFTFIEREDLCLNVDCEFESIIAEIINEKGERNLLVGEIYRVPGTNENDSVCRYEQVMSSLCETNNDVILGTDQNFDYLKLNENSHVSKLHNICIGSGILPTITRPTRVTGTSATLIDNLYVKTGNYENISSKIITTDISDHFTVLAFIGISSNIISKKEPLEFKYRPLNQNSINAICVELENTDWNAILNNEQLDACYEAFLLRFNSIIDTHAPIKNVTIPYKAIIREPWMTSGLIKSSKKRDKLYKKSLGKPKDSIAFMKYKEYRNTYNSIKRLAKKNYYTELFKQYGDNIAKTWKIINSMVGRTRHKSSLPETLLINDTIESDPVLISNAFSSYFQNIGQNLAAKIHSSKHPSNYFMNTLPVTTSAFFKPTDSMEIFTIINSCKAKKSVGDDGISMELLKITSKQICEPLSKLMNMSIEQGIVPESMKLAKVIPVHKGKSRSALTNYRPISLLSNISKIFEKIIHNRTYSFLMDHNVLYSSQYGFRPEHSTTDAVTEFLADVHSSVDQNEHCLSVYLDLSKAFDTINHEILLRKLNHYGIRGKALEWFKSYLFNRRQYIFGNGIKSDETVIKCGVPQGSVLGPLLFIIYTNDIPCALTHSKSILYADDTTIYITGCNMRVIGNNMNSDLAQLADWFKANQLSVNIDKTKYMLFSRNSNTNPDLQICIDTKNLEQVNVIKFLGLYIDDKLKWDLHIQHCKKKIASGIYALNMTKRILKYDHLKSLYYSLIHPFLLYGNIF